MSVKKVNVLIATVDGKRWSFDEAGVSLGANTLVIRTDMATITFILSNVIWFKSTSQCDEKGAAIDG